MRLAFLLCICGSIAAAAPAPPPATRPAPPPAAPALSKVDMTKVLKGAKVYPIQDGEVAVNGSRIKRIELGKNTAVITYSNKTNVDHQPDYLFRLYDAYGIEVGGFADSWVIEMIKPGEVRKEEKRFGAARLEELLQYSAIKLPADWRTPMYLVVERNDP
jgi:hypothetical protein